MDVSPLHFLTLVFVTFQFAMEVLGKKASSGWRQRVPCRSIKILSFAWGRLHHRPPIVIIFYKFIILEGNLGGMKWKSFTG